MGFNPFSPTLALGLVATTGDAGFALQNGTPNILTWTAPNDGNMHRFIIMADQHVTSAETGGAITVDYDIPDGNATTIGLYAGGSGTGISGQFYGRLVEPGAAVTVVQSSALSAGAAILWAELWAA